MNAPLAMIAFETRVEELRRILVTTGWEFSLWNDSADEEPRIRDTDAATRLGYTQARDVRKLIARIWRGDKRPIQRATVARRNVRGGGVQEYTTQEFWLTEAELLKLVARSETPIAEAMLDEMIAVFMAVRRHMLTTTKVLGHARRKPVPRPVIVPTPPPAPAPPPSRRLVEIPLTMVVPAEVADAFDSAMLARFAPGTTELPSPDQRALHVGALAAQTVWSIAEQHAGRVLCRRESFPVSEAAAAQTLWHYTMKLARTGLDARRTPRLS